MIDKKKLKPFQFFWTSNFLTFFGIMVGVLTYVYTNSEVNSSNEDAFRKKIIISVNDLLSNTNLLCYSLRKLEQENQFDKKELSYLLKNIKFSESQYIKVNQLLNSDVYINQISDENLFDLLGLLNLWKLNLVSISLIPEYSLEEKRLRKQLDIIVSYEFLVANALRKAYRINLETYYVENFIYFDQDMIESSLLDYGELNIILNLEGMTRRELVN